MSSTLVVMLHGCVQPASEFAVATRMNEAAAARGWATLWPEQSLEAHELRCWNWFRPEHQTREGGEPARIASMIDRFERVFLAGISAGAAMGAILGATYPERFDAIAMHSGVPFGAARSIAEGLALMRSGESDAVALGVLAHGTMGARARVMPAMVLHGGVDAALHARNGTNLARQWAVANALALGKSAAVPSTREREHREDGRYDALIVDYDGVQVEEWRIPRLGHAWSGGDPAATYTDPNGPDATAAILDFFSRSCRP